MAETSLSNTTACPCQSGKPYADCCQPLHLGLQTATHAEQLMHSRYCAYVMQLIDYIIHTTAPSQQGLLNRAELQQWAETTHWTGLTIQRVQPALSKIHSQVEFTAFFEQNGKQQCHHEQSLFVLIQQRWYFVDPTVPLPSLKQPCLCGSGKKFKHCCAVFL